MVLMVCGFRHDREKGVSVDLIQSAPGKQDLGRTQVQE